MSDVRDRPIIINTLGAIEIVAQGEPVALRPAQRRLLAILSLETDGAGLPTNLLIDRMWGDDAPTTAPSALQVHLSGLRKVLGDLVMTTPHGYCLDWTRIANDRLIFEEHVRAAENARSAQDWPNALESSRRALALWRGAPLPDISGDLFALAEVTRLRAMQVEAAQIGVEALLALGDNDVALPLVRGLVEEHPLNERFRHMLMLAFYRSGRPGEALRAYQDFRRYLGETMGIEAGEELRELEGQILVHDPTLGEAPPAATPNNLPPTPTSFVGRDADLTELDEALSGGRLVTIVGAPGVGKTRLAVEAARVALDIYPGGVWFADLSGSTTSQAVAATITASTRTSDQIESIEQLAAALRPRPILLILDNCEHMLDPVRRLVVAIISEPGRCRILATSRHPLDLAGEVLHRLAPLAASLDQSVALLADRMRATDRTFTVTAHNRAALLEICARVDGVPLGIELVAKTASTIGLADTARLLEQISGDTALEGTFAWSSQLLPEGDRLLLSRLSVFSAPFTLQRATTICGDNEALAVAGAISRLVEASLVMVEWRKESARYRLLQPIRDMAATRLSSRDREALARTHAHSFLASAEEMGIGLATTLNQAETFPMLDVETPDYRTALSWLGRTGDWAGLLKMAETLAPYWYARFLAWEGRVWLRDVPADTLEDIAQERLHKTAGFLAWAAHAYEEADRHYLELAAVGERTANRRTVADSLYGRGLIHQKRRFLDGAAMLEEAANIYESLPGCDLELGQCLLFRGLDEASNGEADLAYGLLGRAAELLTDAGHLRQVSKAERWLAHCAWRQTDEARARRHADRAVELAHLVGDRIALAGAYIEQATIETEWGEPTAAAGHLIEALEPMPSHDEVDISQVLLPVARLAHKVGNEPLAGGILDRIDDIYQRNGWCPLDQSPSARILMDQVDRTEPLRGDLMESVAHFLASCSEPGS